MMTIEIMSATVGIHDWVKFRSNICLLGLLWRVFDKSDDKKSHYYSNRAVFERK